MLTPKSRRNVIAAAIVVALAVLLALANRWNQRRQQGLPRELSGTVESLISKAAQYNGSAQQDGNPLFALLHANYGLAYWTVARSLASDESIAQLTGYSPLALGQQLEQALQGAMRALQGSLPAPPSAPPSALPSAPTFGMSDSANPLAPVATRAVPMPLGAPSSSFFAPNIPQPSSSYALPQGYSPV
jgi:hypothetical protein